MKHKNAGFSLVEIAVVIGIIGLILGGIMAGRHVIAAAELNAVVKEAEYYTAAQNAFRDKYNSYPGDMPDATRFFGRDIHMSTGADNTTCLNGYTGANATITSGGTCNGDGDGYFGSSTLEVFSWPQQLASAQLIDGTYSGLYGYNQLLIGVIPNAKTDPQSRKSPGIWRGVCNSVIGRAAYGWNTIPLGAAGVTIGGDVLTPDEAWAMDKKFDDGSPTQGTLTTTNANPVPAFLGKVNCTVKADGSANPLAANTDAIYNLKYQGKACDMIFYFSKTR